MIFFLIQKWMYILSFYLENISSNGGHSVNISMINCHLIQVLVTRKIDKI